MSRSHPYSFVRNKDAEVVTVHVARKPTRPLKIYSGAARASTLDLQENPVLSTRPSDVELTLPCVVPSCSTAPSVPLVPSPSPAPSAGNSSKERFHPYSFGRNKINTKEKNLKDFRPSPAPIISKVTFIEKLPEATTSKARATKSTKAPKSKKVKMAPLMQKSIKDYRLAMATRH